MSLGLIFVFVTGVLAGSGTLFKRVGGLWVTYMLAPIGFILLIRIVIGAFDPVDPSVTQSDPRIAYLVSAGLGVIFGILPTLLHRLYLPPSGAGIMDGFGFLGRAGIRWPRFNFAKQVESKSADTVYYETVVKLGALVAMADGKATPSEYAVLKTVFKLNAQTCSGAGGMYQAQLQNPERLRQILSPFLRTFGHGSAVADTLIFGMAKVAQADGQLDFSELGLIRMAAQRLGLSSHDSQRIMASAGLFGESRFDSNSRGKSKSKTDPKDHRRAPLTERERYLQTLRLKPGASTSAIRSAWRKLAAKYHPDKLYSQNLPEAETEKAEQIMQEINQAYDWLKDNP